MTIEDVITTGGEETAAAEGGGELPLEAVEDFNLRWDAFEVLGGEEVLEIVSRAHRDRPATRRDIVMAWLAWRLGYSRLLRRKESLLREPVWDLLAAEPFDRLGLTGQRALHIIAQTTPGPYRTTLHPKAALAAIALWRNSGNPALRSEARRLLTEHSLPEEIDWLWRLVLRFAEVGADGPLESEGRPGLLELARLQLQAGYWEVPARLGGLHLTRRYSRWSPRLTVERIVGACDRAAEQHWKAEAGWMLTMAEAALGGRLRFSWLEKPVSAALRVAVDHRWRYERLAEYHNLRLYDADAERLEQLHGHLLEHCDDAGRIGRWARWQLYEEILKAADQNPHRARRLAELVILERHPLRFRGRETALRHALRQIEEKVELAVIDELLAGLYVATYDIDPHALRFVHKTVERIDWEAHPVVGRSKLELYLKVSDYDRAFRNLTCEVEGTTLQLADKDAAARVLYFVERRFDPSRLTRSLHHLFEPVEWLGSTLLPADPLHELAEQSMAYFQERVGREDLRDHVVDRFIEAGVPVSDFESIAQVGTDFIEDLLARPRECRVLLAGFSGGMAGAFAPVYTEWNGRFMGLSDVPVKLALTAEICSRFCWYYGFDPNEHPELPVQILAVALEGPNPPSIDGGGDRLRHGLAEYTLQTSILVEALGTRSLGRVVSRALSGMTLQMARSLPSGVIAVAIERWLRRQLDKHGDRTRRWWHKVLAAGAGAALDSALIYDVCESAQAVLTDRFLARKYAGWEQQIGAEYSRGGGR